MPSRNRSSDVPIVAAISKVGRPAAIAQDANVCRISIRAPMVEPCRLRSAGVHCRARHRCRSMGAPFTRREQERWCRCGGVFIDACKAPSLSERDDAERTVVFPYERSCPPMQDTPDVEELRCRSTSRRSSARSSTGRSPVRRADERDRAVVAQELVPRSRPRRGVAKGRISVRFGSGFGIAFAGFVSSSPTATAYPRTCRSAFTMCHASPQGASSATRGAPTPRAGRGGRRRTSPSRTSAAP